MFKNNQLHFTSVHLQFDALQPKKHDKDMKS